MKDFPVFTTEHGAASLVLKEIPYRAIAYIHIRSSEEPEALLDECISFCRACGAEKIYASGHPVLEKYRYHASVYEMRGVLDIQEEEIPSMFPVTEQTISKWRELCNSKMQNIDQAGTLEAKDEAKILKSGGAYFIHEAGNVTGIGWLEDDRLNVIASFRPGAGETVCKAMQSLIPTQQMILEVASTNKKAIQLYERVGFLKTAELSRWYQVL